MRKILGFGDGNSEPKEGFPWIEKDGVTGILFNEKEDKVLLLKYPNGWHGFITGGVEKGDSFEETILREIKEETGYTNVEIMFKVNTHKQEYFHEFKNINGKGMNKVFACKLKSEKKVDILQEELEKHTPVWVKKENILDALYFNNHKDFWKEYIETKK